MKKRMNGLIKHISIVLGFLLLGLIILLTIPYSRALIVMNGVSYLEERSENQAITLSFNEANLTKIGWFPKMILYKDKGGFRKELGKDVDLSIYYTFGGFENGASLIYDEDSSFYSAFCGAYVIRGLGQSYGQMVEGSEEEINLLAKVPAYDYTKLILRDLGYKGQAPFDVTLKNTFDVQSQDGEISYHGLDLSVETLGVNHIDQGFVQHYLQFGRPSKDNDQSFELVGLKGKIAYYYDSQLDTYVVFYCIGPDQDLIEKTFEAIIKHARVNIAR